MMDNMERLDMEIRDKLMERAEGLLPDTKVKERIDADIDSADIVEIGGFGMKNKRFVKAAAIVGACLALSGTTAYGVGHASQWISHSSPNEYTEYADIEKVEAKTGLEIDLPEEFSNGYVFDSASVTHNERLDDDGNKLDKFKSAYVGYKKQGEPLINIDIDPARSFEEDDGAVETREIADGIVAEYDVHEMLIVPPDYKVSDEDLEREKNDPKFWISYGSDEVERKITSNVTFTINGQMYSIMGFDLDMTADEMFEMAEEIVNR